MSVQNQDALKYLGQDFKESKRKQMLSFLEDQKQISIRLRKCSFDVTPKQGSGDSGRTHRLRPLSARPNTAEPSEPYSDQSEPTNHHETQRRSVSKLVRRPSTACGLHPSTESNYSDEESEFDALSVTSIQSGTPSIGELGSIDELDEPDEEACETSIVKLKLQRQRSDAIDIKLRDETTSPSSDNSPNFSAKFSDVSSVTSKRVPTGKPRAKSRRKSASSLRNSKLSIGAHSSIVEPGTITSVTTIECPASLYKKIRHHSAPATRNDEIIARMGQQSKRPVGLFRLPPLASQRALAGASSSEHSSPSPETTFIRTQSLLKTEPIL